MRRFRSSVLCGREELLTFLNFKAFYMHKNINKILKEKGEHNMSPLIMYVNVVSVSQDDISHK